MSKSASLTEKQRLFAHLLIAGENRASAYRMAYGCSRMSNDAASKAASRLSKNDEFSAYLDTLHREAASKAVMVRRERLEWLSARVYEWQPGEDIRPALQCIAELNRMDLQTVQADACDRIASVEERLARIREIFGLDTEG